MNTVTGNNTNTVTFSYSKVYIWSIALCSAETSDISERKSEIPGKIFKHGAQEGCEYQTESGEMKKYYNESRRRRISNKQYRKTNWIRHILRRNCLL